MLSSLHLAGTCLLICSETQTFLRHGFGSRSASTTLQIQLCKFSVNAAHANSELEGRAPNQLEEAGKNMSHNVKKPGLI